MRPPSCACGPSHPSTRTSLAPATAAATTPSLVPPLFLPFPLLLPPTALSCRVCRFSAAVCQRGRSRRRQTGGSGFTSLTLVWVQLQRPRGGGGRGRRTGRVPKLDAHLHVAGDQQGEQHGDRGNRRHLQEARSASARPRATGVGSGIALRVSPRDCSAAVRRLSALVCYQRSAPRRSAVRNWPAPSN